MSEIYGNADVLFTNPAHQGTLKLKTRFCTITTLNSKVLWPVTYHVYRYAQYFCIETLEEGFHMPISVHTKVQGMYNSA